MNQLVFEKLETVNAKSGNSGDKESYSVTDNEPTMGENIYRVALFKTGEDTPQYSDLIKLDFSQFADFMIFPNPATDYVDVDLETVRYRAVELTLTDATGKVLQQRKIESAPIAPVRMTLEGLAAGLYFIRVDSEGKREMVKKLIVVR